MVVNFLILRNWESFFKFSSCSGTIVRSFSFISLDCISGLVMFFYFIVLKFFALP